MISLRVFLVGKYHLADGRVKHPGPEHLIRLDRGLSDSRRDFCQIWARCPDEEGVLELRLSNAPHDEPISAWVETHNGTFTTNPNGDRATYAVTIRMDPYRVVKSLAKQFDCLSKAAKGPSESNRRRLCRRIKAVLSEFASDLKAYQVLKLAGSPVPGNVGSAASDRGLRDRPAIPDASEPDLFAIMAELPSPTGEKQKTGA